MNRTGQLIYTSIVQALHELRANKLRTSLSLLGITIGIFCIIAVFTVLDSMKKNIRDEISGLGSDVLYVGRWPWMDEGGEYKWWEFLRRPSMTTRELEAVERDVNDVEFATIMYKDPRMNVRYQDVELEGLQSFAVMHFFDKIQNIEVRKGRYLSLSEIDGGVNSAVIGAEVYENLFPNGGEALGKNITFNGSKFNVVGIMQKAGQNIAGFNYDNAIIYPYHAAAKTTDLTSRNNDPMLIVKVKEGRNIEDVELEVTGALRRIRKVAPGEKDNFAINRLSQISERLDTMFASINVIGGAIAFFSLVVGAFGIANIMFVTVKERTKVIGLKKAIGAKRKSILTEFLVEAVTLCVTGGLIGILLVLLLSLALTYGADFPVTLSLQNFMIGVSISAVVGILAGFIPARSASRLDPVVAIRTN